MRKTIIHFIKIFFVFLFLFIPIKSVFAVDFSILAFFITQEKSGYICSGDSIGCSSLSALYQINVYDDNTTYVCSGDSIGCSSLDDLYRIEKSYYDDDEYYVCSGDTISCSSLNDIYKIAKYDDDTTFVCSGSSISCSSLNDLYVIEKSNYNNDESSICSGSSIGCSSLNNLYLIEKSYYDNDEYNICSGDSIGCSSLTDLYKFEAKSTYSYDYSYNSDILDYLSSCPENSSLGTDNKCYCNDGYKVNDSKDGCVKILCSANSKLVGNECVCNDGYIKNGAVCLTYSDNCQQQYGPNTYGDTNYCYCSTGYKWNTDKNKCINDSPCFDIINSYLANDGKCYCKDGYIWDNVNSKCIIQPITNSTSIEDINNFVTEEKNKLTTIDEILTSRLKGKILLQVENKGQAWYINPKDGKRHYMADGSEAYRIMRELGVGITNTDLDKVKTNISFAKKHSGKIFLQVEDLGQAFYIDFDGIAHYLKDGKEAYNIMRDLGLGITNDDLNKIDIYN